VPILKQPHNIPAVPVASQVVDDDGKLTQEFVHFLRAVADLVRDLHDIEVLARTSDWRAPVQAEITVDSDILPVPDGTVNLGGAGAKFNNAYLAGTVQADGGFNTSGTATNIIQAPNGGVYGKQIATDTAVYMLPNSTAPTASTSTYGGLGYNTGSTYWYWNGTAFATVDLSAAGAAQTPWTGNVDAANHSLSNLTGITGSSGSLSITATVTISGGLALTGLPSTAPAAGSKRLWYDPADGNRVKFVP